MAATLKLDRNVIGEKVRVKYLGARGPQTVNAIVRELRAVGKAPTDTNLFIATPAGYRTIRRENLLALEMGWDESLPVPGMDYQTDNGSDVDF
jgi:hypothetical protein